MSFDFSAVDHFWRMSEELTRGCEPGDRLWSAIFATAAYRALTASEFSRDFFKTCWRAAFRPDCEAETVSPHYDRFIDHYRRTARQRVPISKFLGELDGSGWLYERARKQAMEHLPPAHYPEDPEVAFAPFDLDGRGYRPIVIDPLCALTLAEKLVPFLAHEFHHHYVCQLTGLELGVGPDARTDLQWVVDQVHLEGLADMVNRDSAFEQGQSSPGFVSDVDEAPDYLASMNEHLRAVRRHPGDSERRFQKLRSNLASSGHPLGYYMARVIRRYLGRERLLETAHDPLLFFRCYVQAGERGGLEVTLQPEALEVLEQYYLRG